MAVIDADRFNAFEREGWAENSSDAYDRVFGPITGRVIDDLLDVAEVGAHTRVLDVATGPGYVAARAASRGAEAIGVDLSPQMLDVARRTHPHVDFRRADAEELPLPEASFDAVVANFCLLHLGRPEKPAAGFARVLSPGVSWRSLCGDRRSERASSASSSMLFVSRARRCLQRSRR